MIPALNLNPETRAALQAAEAALAEARADGRPYAVCQALRQLGRLQAGALQLAQAEQQLQQALRWAHAGLGIDLQVDILCDLCDMTDLWSQAEDQLPDGDGDAVRERTRAYVLQTCERAPSMSERNAEARVMLRLSAVVGRCGEDELQQLMLMRARQLMAGALPVARTQQPAN